MHLMLYLYKLNNSETFPMLCKVFGQLFQLTASLKKSVCSLTYQTDTQQWLEVASTGGVFLPRYLKVVTHDLFVCHISD